MPMHNFIDLTGQRFGRLYVTERAPSVIRPNGTHVTRWKCTCDCGAEVTVSGPSLRKGTTKSCGCLRKELPAEKHKKHDMVGSKPYHTWAGMIQRCENPKQRHYQYYGGRGISVCEAWHDFQTFWNDMRDGYKDGLQIDRIDNNGNYEPGNCRWTTRSENMCNTRRARTAYVDPYGLITLRRLSELTAVPFKTLCSRYHAGKPILNEDECARLGLSLKEETNA